MKTGEAEGRSEQGHMQGREEGEKLKDRDKQRERKSRTTKRVGKRRARHKLAIGAKLRPSFPIVEGRGRDCTGGTKL